MVFGSTSSKLLAGLAITGLTAGVAVCAYSSYCNWVADRQEEVADWEVWSVPGDVAVCPICLDSFFLTIERLDKLGCGHVFHNSCIRRWILNHMRSTCPVCRRPCYVTHFLRIPCMGKTKYSQKPHHSSILLTGTSV